MRHNLVRIDRSIETKGFIFRMASLTFWIQSSKKRKHQPPQPDNVSHLEEGSLAALAHRVDAVLVEAAGGGDGGVVVHSLAAVHGPVVVAVVVDGAVAVEHEAVLTDLLVQSAWGRETLVSGNKNLSDCERLLPSFPN